MARACLYHLTASRRLIEISLSDDFWAGADAFIDQHGTTRLDVHVQELAEEIKNALFYIHVSDDAPN